MRYIKATRADGVWAIWPNTTATDNGAACHWSSNSKAYALYLGRFIGSENAWYGQKGRVPVYGNNRYCFQTSRFWGVGNYQRRLIGYETKVTYHSTYITKYKYAATIKSGSVGSAYVTAISSDALPSSPSVSIEDLASSGLDEWGIAGDGLFAEKCGKNGGTVVDGTPTQQYLLPSDSYVRKLYGFSYNATSNTLSLNESETRTTLSLFNAALIQVYNSSATYDVGMQINCNGEAKVDASVSNGMYNSVTLSGGYYTATGSSDKEVFISVSFPNSSKKVVVDGWYVYNNGYTSTAITRETFEANGITVSDDNTKLTVKASQATTAYIYPKITVVDNVSLKASTVPSGIGVLTVTDASGETVATSSNGVLLASIYSGDSYTLTATPPKTADGDGELRPFVGWYTDAGCTALDNTEATRTVSITADTTLYAKFGDEQGYSVTASATTMTGGVATGCSVAFTPGEPDFTDAGTFANKRTLTFTALCAEGWDFYGWNVNDAATDTASGLTKPVQINSADLVVSALFKHKEYGFSAAWDSASDNIENVQFSRQKWNADSNAWEAISDAGVVYHGDRVRVYVKCQSTGYTLGKVTGADGAEIANTIQMDADGTSFYVEFDAVSSDIDLTLYLAGELSVSFSGTDDWVSASLYGEDGATVEASTTKSGDGNALSTCAILGTKRKIAVKKLEACTDADYNFFGWYLDGGTEPVPDAGFEFDVLISAPSASYVAKWESGDPSIYLKITLDKDCAGFGDIVIVGGTVIDKATYKAAKGGFDVDGDLASAKYLKCNIADTITVSLSAGSGKRFSKWTVQSVTPGAVPTYEDKSQIMTAAFNYTVMAHAVLTARFRSAETLKRLTVYTNGAAVSFSPDGTSLQKGGGVVSAQYYSGDVVSVGVLPPAGMLFAGLYRNSALTTAYDGTNVTINDDTVLYVKLGEDSHAVFAFGIGAENMTAHWRSKLFVATRPWSPTAMRVEADAYRNLRVRVLQASSPDKAQEDEDVFDRNAKPLTIKDQDQRRIALRRPEKHIMVDVVTNDPVSTVTVASSSGGLIL